jgi:N-acetyl-anhydromuramyl-L-alanine amidase AmpD
VTAATIHGWHQGQGWIGIGYHYVIRANGTIERGRPEDTIGSHSGPQGNGDSVGIVLTGNFEIGAPSTAQMIALAELIKDLRGRYGNLAVIGHRDVMATACPGRNFPWDDLKRRLEAKQVDQWKLDIIAKAKAAGMITIDHDPDEPASKWFVLQVILNALGGK